MLITPNIYFRHILCKLPQIWVKWILSACILKDRRKQHLCYNMFSAHCLCYMFTLYCATCSLYRVCMFLAVEVEAGIEFLFEALHDLSMPRHVGGQDEHCHTLCTQHKTVNKQSTFFYVIPGRHTGTVQNHSSTLSNQMNTQDCR